MLKQRDPIVAVIIPTRNRSSLLRRAINSVLIQTYEKFKIYVIDDHSDEDISGLISSYMDNRIHYLKLINAEGGGAARAYGVSTCHEELVCFLDSDDEWHPEKLKLQVLEWYRHPPGDFFCYTDVIRVYGDGVGCYSYVSPLVSNTTSLAELLFAKGFDIQTSSYMFSRELINRINFRCIPKHQDWDLLFRLNADGVPFIRVSLPLTLWHQSTGGNVSAINNTTHSISWFYDCVKPYFDEHKCELGFYERVVFNHIHRSPLVLLNLLKMSELSPYTLLAAYISFFIKKIKAHL